MNRRELITILREEYLDDNPDSVDQDDNDYRWGEAFLTRGIATAEAEACRRAKLLFDDTTAAVCVITLASGTASYSLSDKITSIEEVVYESEPLEKIMPHELVDQYGADWREDTGTPTHYLVKGRKIQFYPTPTDDEDTDEITLEVFRLPLARFTTTPEIPEEYHLDLLSYVAYQCLRRRDEDTEDQKKAKSYLKDFEEIFGPSVNARIREHQLTTKPTISFRSEYGYHNPGLATRYVNEDNW